MRQFALLGLVLLVSGCGTSFGDFLGDTFTYGANPNAPLGDSENMRRVRGIETGLEPLTAEPGNIWPGPAKPPPTLQDLEKQQSGETFGPPPGGTGPYLPDHRQPRPTPGSSTPPPSNQQQLPPEMQLAPPSVNAAPPTPGQEGRTVPPTPGEEVPGVTTGGTSHYQTYTTPGGEGIMVPNGNGTSTIIRPNGTVETIPTPK
jgi:hypothetical protein